MTYNGSLPVTGWLRHLTHSAAGGFIAAVGASDGGLDEGVVIDVFADDFFERQASIGLPCFQAGARAVSGHGRFVFASNDGTELVVLVQAHPASSLLKDFARVRLPLEVE